jgi:hypothetical protein
MNHRQTGSRKKQVPNERLGAAYAAGLKAGMLPSAERDKVTAAYQRSASPLDMRAFNQGVHRVQATMVDAMSDIASLSKHRR